jgi:hypothetical protein
VPYVIKQLQKTLKNYGEKMKTLQKSGGLAALYAGVAYIIGMLGFLLVVGWPADPVQQVAVLVNNHVT